MTSMVDGTFGTNTEVMAMSDQVSSTKTAAVRRHARPLKLGQCDYSFRSVHPTKRDLFGLRLISASHHSLDLTTLRFNLLLTHHSRH